MRFPQVPKSKQPELDEKLASITDQVLSGEMYEHTEMNDIEAEHLKNFVLHIQASIRVEQPDPVMATRMKNRLQAEWQANWQRQHAARKRRQLVFSSALVAFLLCALIIAGYPAAPTLAGTAEQPVSWTTIIAVLGAILMAVLMWMDHHR